MKVAFDVSPLKSAHQFRGVGSYTKNLLDALVKLKIPNFSLELIKDGKIPSDSDVVHYPYFDLFFLTLPFLKNKPTVVTIHDVIPLIFPKNFPAGLRGKMKFLLQKKSLVSCSAVITDSEVSKIDVVRYLDFPKEKIFVVHLAPGGEFKRLKLSKSDGIRKKYQLPDKFVLYVGDINWNKNIPGLVKACESIKTSLVIVGKQARENINNSSHPENQDLVWLQDYCKLHTSVILTGFVFGEELATIYNLATVYCQPSFYEGFGLPVLEAMACGCPVVTARAGSLSEISGEAALQVDPHDINSIANAVKRVISDKTLREKLMKKGLTWVKKFSWQKTALATYRVYDQISC